MDERTLAAFPGVAVGTPLGVRVYTLLLTERRTLLVLEGGDHTLIRDLLGESPAGIVPVGREEALDLEALAAEGRNLSIPHAALRQARIRQRGYSIGLTLASVDAEGRRQTLRAQVVPPPAYAERLRAAGKQGTAFAAYARGLQEAYDRVIPRGTGIRRSWRASEGRERGG